MKAVIYADIDKAEVVEKDIPVIGDGEALIKVKSFGLCGSDMGIIAGKHPRAKKGVVPGHEFAGELVEVKGDRDDLKSGDKVTVNPLLFCGKCWACRNGFVHVCEILKMIGIDVDGGMAEYVKVPAELVLKIPDTIDMTLAAMIEPLAVGIHSCRIAGINPEQNAVIMGAGPIGLIVGLCLKNYGYSNVIITDINPVRLKMAEDFGLTALNAKECAVIEEIKKLTNNDYADVLYECAGSQTAADQMCDIVHPKGKIIMVSVHKDAHKVDLRAINFKEIEIIGSRVYALADLQEAIELVDKLPVDQLISVVLPIDEFVNGLEQAKSGQNICKIVFNV
ncbi:MAG: zinc-dependent alcohol dehydrogenase [Planctomycetota bacterium]|jgi:2-desacetyl-2-hydroxyethyl bacteriochlorophyllide A dehydrogenase